MVKKYKIRRNREGDFMGKILSIQDFVTKRVKNKKLSKEEVAKIEKVLFCDDDDKPKKCNHEELKEM